MALLHTLLKLLLLLLLVDVNDLIAIFLYRGKRLQMRFIYNVLLFFDGLGGCAFLNLTVVTIAARLDGGILGGQRALPLKAFGG